MANNQVIQVPPNFIVTKYSPVKKTTKRPIVAADALSLSQSSDVDWHGQSNMPTFSEPVYDVNGNLTHVAHFSVRVDTLKALHEANIPIIIIIPALDYPVNDTCKVNAWGTAIPLTVAGAGAYYLQFDVGAADFDAIGLTHFMSIDVTYTRKPLITYYWNVQKPFYPFDYEEKTLGLANEIAFIAPAKPTWIDIDINSLFIPPKSISCDGTKPLYVLHKNLTQL